MHSFLSFLALASSASAVAVSSAEPRALAVNNMVREGFTNTWADTFAVGANSPSGKANSESSSHTTLKSSNHAISQLSETNWIYDLGTSYPGGAAQWGGNEQQTYTKDLKNIHINANGQLAIVPIKRAGKWTSARVHSKRDFSCKPMGKLLIEIRAKVPNSDPATQQGIWPALWALGSEFRGNWTNWPQATEWDIMEIINGKPEIYGTLHCGVINGGPCHEMTGLGSGPIEYSRGKFTTFGFKVDRTPTTWQQETLTWYLDGKQYFQITGATIGDLTVWTKIAHEPHFLLLNVAVGGAWPGLPNEKTLSGKASQMLVDWVGVWNSN